MAGRIKNNNGNIPSSNGSGGIVYLNPKLPAPTAIPLQPPVNKGSSDVGSDQGGNNKTFRYSGDLELSLPFERNPLDKPSSSFRNADAWFKEVEENSSAYVARPEAAVAGRRSTTQKRGGLWGGGGGASDEPINPSLGRLKSKGGDDSGSSSNNNRSSFRGSAFFRNSIFSPSRRGVNFGDDVDTNNDNKLTSPDGRRRPAGPRGMGDYRPNIGNSGSTATLSRAGGVEIPVPPVYTQIRLYVYTGLLAVSSIAAGIMIHLSLLKPSAFTFPLPNNSTLPPTVLGTPYTIGSTPSSTRFFAAAGLFSFIIAGLSLLGYLLWGKFLFNHYDSPFLICQDLSLGSQSSSSTQMESLDEESGGKTLARLTNPLANPEGPSPYVPLLDVIVHVVVILFWISAVVDVGATIRTVCSANSYCLKTSTAVACGGIAIILVVGSLARKCWEMWRFGVFRSVIKGRAVKY